VLLPGIRTLNTLYVLCALNTLYVLGCCVLQASGFCYINDIVLAILELLKYHRWGRGCAWHC
jgi:hypothetical protein